jgi:hypothetical protein
MASKLTLADIADLRAWERERDEFRRRIIELKKVRRVAVGEMVSLTFENRDTMRFQVQEMARAERLISDAAIEEELAAYNPLIPERGEAVATLFIELTTRGDLEYWLPRLVGIEQRVRIELGDLVVGCEVDPEHAEQLSRQDVTASVHYVRFRFPPEVWDRLDEGEAMVVVEHPAYQASAPLSAQLRRSLMADWD